MIFKLAIRNHYYVLKFPLMTLQYAEHGNYFEKSAILKWLGSYNILSGKLPVTINIHQGPIWILLQVDIYLFSQFLKLQLLHDCFRVQL